jgi:hypothetical protein
MSISLVLEGTFKVGNQLTALGVSCVLCDKLS